MCTMRLISPARIHVCNQSIHAGNAYHLNINESSQNLLSAMKQRTMNKTLKQHLSEENLQRVNKAWKYAKRWRRACLYLLAWWWSLPTAIEIVEWIQNRVNVWITYRLYKGHWVR